MAASSPREPVDHGPPFDPSQPGDAPTQAFLDALTAMNVACEDGELVRLGRYLRHLRDANEHFNLTAVSEPEAMWIRHIADSLSLVPLILSLTESDDDLLESRIPGQPWSVIDVGSGGGLPGIPLAIVLPEFQFTLLEATGKKAKFLEAVVASLGLSNVRVEQARAEDAGRDRLEHRERYDLVLSRAVGPMATLVELTVPFAHVHGIVLAIKGEKAAEEVSEAKQALYALHCHALELIRTPTGTIVPIRKMRVTPKIYPRRPGEPKRVPLGVPRTKNRD
ncbi:MAG: 16S rRNA (guanine(527)-N(7))-methyltransferase RsmG [Phycisphaerae bacterium]|jgi:16S rRNA (guanine527-N7)-methyltransferase|nr:16S rRNA (guanine(527)-N(7))-methyltransferase RsmG [Phycisphaerae bacterium]